MNVHRIRLFLVLMLAFVPLACEPRSSKQTQPATNSSRTNIREDLSRARQAYRNHQFRQSLEILESRGGSSSDHAGVPLLMGHIYYEWNQFERAASHWREAASMSLNPTHRSRLRRRIGRAEQLARHRWRRKSYVHFQVLVPRTLELGVASRINHDLEIAYDDIGGDLSFFPDRQFSVILHKPNTFHRVIRAPSWSSGLYDGKIHLPVRSDRERLYSAGTLYHEYTHALIDFLAGGHCPVWLNEGLATYEEYRQNGKRFPVELLSRAPPGQRLQSLDQIDRLFQSNHAKKRVRLAYEYSYTLVEYLRERHGLNQVRRLLAVAGRRESFERALRQVLSLRPESLFRRWKEWTKGRYLR